MIQSYFEQHQLNGNHDEGLDEERLVELRAWVIKHSEQRRNQHDQGNVERESGAGFRAVDGVGLVGIAGKGGYYDE